mmetsp:Transcript_70018/g.226518  ORF Transcript_70018/g.226518 Transcript_70018/m.226518 type:complete len:342 (+) Transcript_70018:397-1422(+)
MRLRGDEQEARAVRGPLPLLRSVGGEVGHKWRRRSPAGSRLLAELQAALPQEAPRPVDGLEGVAPGEDLDLTGDHQRCVAADVATAVKRLVLPVARAVGGPCDQAAVPQEEGLQRFVADAPEEAGMAPPQESRSCHDLVTREAAHGPGVVLTRQVTSAARHVLPESRDVGEHVARNAADLRISLAIPCLHLVHVLLDNGVQEVLQGEYPDMPEVGVAILVIYKAAHHCQLALAPAELVQQLGQGAVVIDHKDLPPNEWQDGPQRQVVLGVDEEEILHVQEADNRKLALGVLGVAVDHGDPGEAGRSHGCTEAGVDHGAGIEAEALAEGHHDALHGLCREVY